jgi:hypothetical protein
MENYRRKRNVGTVSARVPMNLPFSIEQRADHSGADVRRVIARCDRLDTARAAFRWAREQYPRAWVVLREGGQVIEEAGNKAAYDLAPSADRV